MISCILLNNPVGHLGYFIKTTHWNKLKSDIKFCHIIHHQKKTHIIIDMLTASLKYGSSFHEYFYYKFFEKKPADRKRFATTGKMYAYQLKMNPPQHRHLIEDKLVFLKKYSDFTGRNWIDLNTAVKEDIACFMKNKSKVVLKNSKGQAGQTIRIIHLQNKSASDILNFSRINKLDLMEEFVFQHQALMNLAPESLNTIRIITQIKDNGDVQITGTILRLGYGHDTDNLSTGGIACAIDSETGIVSSPGISFDITKHDYITHPVSGKKIEGFQLPFWNESVELAKKAALLYPQNRSVGWDIAVTDNGPILIEGNHNWGARLWQMPVKKGLKHLLEPS